MTNFVHFDDVPESTRESSFQEPNANSTLIESNHSQRSSHSKHESTPLNSFFRRNTSNKLADNSTCQSHECSTNSVGHMSHIPRPPPSPGTYTVPSIISRSMETEYQHVDNLTMQTQLEVDAEDLFGMIKLKENDVCYTSGTIEWVGRKRGYPINSGFKILNENQRGEPVVKKVKPLDKTFSCGVEKLRECDCADVLPTVNAIVDHLNALHEAVDLVDLRLATLEDVMSN